MSPILYANSLNLIGKSAKVHIANYPMTSMILPQTSSPCMSLPEEDAVSAGTSITDLSSSCVAPTLWFPKS